MTAKRVAAGTPGDKPYDEPADAGDNGSSDDLKSKQDALSELQERERELTAQIAALRSLQADTAALEGQLTTNRDAIDRERQELQTFVTAELKGVDSKIGLAIETIQKDVDQKVVAAKTKWEEARASVSTAADALATRTEELAAAEAAYGRLRQGVAEAKRALAELKALKNQAQAAEGRNEFPVAWFWLLEIQRRMAETIVQGPDKLRAAWEELGRKRKAVDDARRAAEAAKVKETELRKASDDARKNRDRDILELVKQQTESQQPETAA